MTDRQHNGPDYRVGNVLKIVSDFCDLSLRIGAHKETFRALSALAHDCYRAINVRGARVGEVIEAIRRAKSQLAEGSEFPETDRQVADYADMLVKQHDDLRKIGLHFETFERLRMLAEAVRDAISTRQVLVYDLYVALRSVRRDQSILEDLKVGQHAPPPVEEE